jgi:hypothetical protein
MDEPTLKIVAVTAFPLELLKRRIDNPRLRESWDDVPHGTSFQLCTVAPASDALYGFLELTDDGYKRVAPNGHPKVVLDISSKGDTQLELFMTVDARLSKWFYDGAGWEHKRTYDVRVDGEFMVLEGGTALVGVRDKRLCVFIGFDTGETKITPVAEVDPNEPMTIVDDVENRRSFLLYKDVLYDAEGRSVERLPAGLDPVAKVREVWRAIRKQPPKVQPK